MRFAKSFIFVTGVARRITGGLGSMICISRCVLRRPSPGENYSGRKASYRITPTVCRMNYSDHVASIIRRFIYIPGAVGLLPFRPPGRQSVVRMHASLARYTTPSSVTTRTISPTVLGQQL
jgi:hypothetical protein